MNVPSSIYGWSSFSSSKTSFLLSFFFLLRAKNDDSYAKYFVQYGKQKLLYVHNIHMVHNCDNNYPLFSFYVVKKKRYRTLWNGEKSKFFEYQSEASFTILPFHYLSRICIFFNKIIKWVFKAKDIYERRIVTGI